MKPLLALVVALLLFAVPAFAADKAQDKPETGKTPYEQKYYADPFYDEIKEAAKTKDARDMVAFLELKIQDQPDRINAASLWLRDNSIGQRDITKVDALYFLFYSDVMRQLAGAYKKAGDQKSYTDMTKTALMSLYIYELMATVDAERCADPSVLDAVRANTIVPRFDAFRDAFHELTRSDFDFFATTAFIADRKFYKRLPNDFICGLGNAKEADVLQQPGAEALPDVINPATGHRAVRVIPPENYHYSPVYVGETEWQERGDKIRKEMEGNWRQRYDRLSKSPQQ